ncbi:hypothetical protein EDB86DRAFT_1175397 [Lactarius hatsudake]|nr:hypothetical protein EDB86DRAFT_1175397 [Lactarius hatsudake]
MYLPHLHPKFEYRLLSGFRAQCSSSLAFSNVPHWRAALATPARHNPDPNGHLCEVSHHADACTTTSDHLRPTNPISIPDLAALARGSSPSIPTCPQLSRTHIRQLVPREGLRDTDDWVSSRFLDLYSFFLSPTLLFATSIIIMLASMMTGSPFAQNIRGAPVRAHDLCRSVNLVLLSLVRSRAPTRSIRSVRSTRSTRSSLV